jgi:hypothetical protein
VRPNREWLLVEALTASRLGNKEGLEAVEGQGLGGLGDKTTLHSSNSHVCQQQQQQQVSGQFSTQLATAGFASTSCHATTLQYTKPCGCKRRRSCSNGETNLLFAGKHTNCPSLINPHLQCSSCWYKVLWAAQVAVQWACWSCQLDPAALEAKGSWARIAQLHLAHDQVVTGQGQGLRAADADTVKT